MSKDKTTRDNKPTNTNLSLCPGVPAPKARTATIISDKGAELNIIVNHDGVIRMISDREREILASREIDALLSEYQQAFEYIYGPVTNKAMVDIYVKGYVITANYRIDEANAKLAKAFRWTPYGKKDIEPFVAARMIIANHHAKHIMTANQAENLPVYIYVDDSLTIEDDELAFGTYTKDESYFKRACQLYCKDATKRKMEDILCIVDSNCPYAEALHAPELSPLGNGIYNNKTKTLMPYSPDLVITTKIRTKYKKNAPMPSFTNADGTVWTPDMLFPSMTSNPEIAKLLWQVVAAALRPNNPWNHMFWFYSTVGCNGKGTTCRLLRNIIGIKNCAGLNIKDMSKDFMLENLSDKIANIADENPVGTYVDEANCIKAMATGDSFVINAKYRKPFDYTFRGLIVQCLNDMPRLRDRSGSVARRIIMIPFDQTFTGRENPDIKEKYIADERTLEWFVSRAIELDIDKFAKPDECNRLLNEFKEFNSNVQEFFNEVEPQFTWDIIPNQLAYEMYKNWMVINNPSGSVLGRTNFLHEWTQCAIDSGRWAYSSGRRYSNTGRTEGPEMTILRYDVVSWYNTNYPATNHAGRCSFDTDRRDAKQLQGIVRIVPRDPADAQAVALAAEVESNNPTACDVVTVNTELAKLGMTGLKTTEDPENSTDKDSNNTSDQKGE